MGMAHVLRTEFERIIDGCSKAKSHLVYRKLFCDEYKRVKDNRKYKDRYLGERCFILGNGPSLKQVDFELLCNEYVFSCNFFDKCTDFQKAKPNFHFFMDPVFILDKEDTKWDKADILNTYKKIGEQGAEVFMPIQACNAVKEYSLESFMKINYLACWGDVFRWKEKFECDIAKQIPGYATVVQTAIHVAIYMGFKEIYLLGCDNTYLMSLFMEVINNNQEDSHAYSTGKSEKKEKQQLISAGLTQATYGQYAQFYGFDYLKEAAAEKHVTIVNCTEKSLLTNFPKSTLQEVIKKERHV